MAQTLPLLLCDPRVAAVPVHDLGEPLVALGPFFGPNRTLVRAGLRDRLVLAATALPPGFGLCVVEGHRSVGDQQAIIDRYAAQLRSTHPWVDDTELHRLTSRFVSPVAVAPHLAGAAVDLTLVDATGRRLDLGTEIDATPEESDGQCFFDAPGLSVPVRARRALLADALGGAGLVNYPTEWWHWSYGDRYWALTAGAPAACYGPVAAAVAA